MTLDSNAVMFGVGIAGFVVMVLDRVVQVVRGYTSGEGDLKTQIALLSQKVESMNASVTQLVSKQDIHQGDHQKEIADLDRRLTLLEARVKP